MSDYGSSVYDDLRGFIRNTKATQRKITSERQRTERSLENSLDSHLNLCTQLAEFYLPELDQNHIKESINTIRRKAEETYKRKLRRKEHLEDYLITNDSERVNAERSLRGITAQLEIKVKERDSTIEKVEAMLNANQKYLSLKTETEKEIIELERMEEQTKRFKKEAQEKLKDYESSLFFTYLKAKNFGDSEQYKSKGLVRILDKRLAKRKNFRENKENYDSLTKMPGLMDEKIEEKREQVTGLKDEIDRIETRAEKEYNLDRIIMEGNTIAQKRQNKQGKIGSLDRERIKAEAELKRLTSTKGDYYESVISGAAKVFTNERIKIMIERAESTPDPRDDRIVNQIDEVRQNIKDFRENAEKLSKKERTISKKLEGMKKIERHFTNEDYESSRSRFDSSFDINKMLNMYLLGKMSQRNITSKMDSSQHFKPRPTPTYRSSSSSSSSWGSSSSGGGFSSGTSFGGGGFSTGGGF